MKTSKEKKNSTKEIEPIDIHSDVEKDAAGILWYKPGFVRDPSVWTKTDKEKKALKKAKNSYHGKFLSSWNFTKPHIPCYGNIIIELYKSTNKNCPSKTTISIYCGQSDIPEILDRHDFVSVKGENVPGNVRRYKWNGKWYGRNELPYYYW